MPAGPWIPYDTAGLNIGGAMNLLTDAFKVVLLASGYTPNVGSHTVFGDLTNEIAAANGYVAGGWTMTGRSWTQSGGLATFTSDNPTWTASGGSITAHYAVLYNDTVVSPAKPLLCYCQLDTTSGGQDVTAADGANFRITLPAAGYFQRNDS